MQRQNTYNCKTSINFVKISSRQLNLRHHPFIFPSSLPERIRLRLKCLSKGRISSSIATTRLEFVKLSPKQCFKVKVAAVNQGELSDEDDELCPVECVREVRTDEEFLRILDKAKGTETLVVVDFYRTSCGSCKYIEQGFAKLCKGSGDQEAAVIFLKHNVSSNCLVLDGMVRNLFVKDIFRLKKYKNSINIPPEGQGLVFTMLVVKMSILNLPLSTVHQILSCYILQVIDEYDDQSEIAERLRIKVTFLASLFFHSSLMITVILKKVI